MLAWWCEACRDLKDAWAWVTEKENSSTAFLWHGSTRYKPLQKYCQLNSRNSVSLSLSFCIILNQLLNFSISIQCVVITWITMCCLSPISWYKTPTVVDFFFCDQPKGALRQTTHVTISPMKWLKRNRPTDGRGSCFSGPSPQKCLLQQPGMAYWWHYPQHLPLTERQMGRLQNDTTNCRGMTIVW